MATNFPAALDSFTNPGPTDTLDSVTVPHYSQHADANDAIEALQAKVGIDSSEDPASLDKRIATLEASTNEVRGLVDGQTTLAYNETTRTVTLTGTNFDVFVESGRYTKNTVSLQHDDVQGGHFFYYDQSGNFVTGQTPWNLLLHAPVAFVFWDATNNLGICFEERHNAGRDIYWHRNQHAAEGTKATSGFAISGYTEDVGTSDAAVTFSIATGRLEDEDIRVDTQVLADGGPYTILERVGVSGDWQITRGHSLPFLYSGNTLQYNQNTGATWQRTNLTEDYFVNYWVFGVTALPTTSITPAPSSTQQIIIIPGQAIFSTEAAAHGESTASIAWGNMPFQEICPLYQITLRFNASNPSAYSNTARCAIARAVRVIGTSASITAAAQADHGSLSGLGDDDHPQYALVDGSRAITLKEVTNIVHTIADGAAFEIDPANGSVQVVTLGASRTPAATNFEAGQTVLLGIDDGTAYSITWTTVNPTWVKAGGSASAPTLAATGYTWVLLWKVGSTIYAGEVGQP